MTERLIVLKTLKRNRFRMRVVETDASKMRYIITDNLSIIYSRHNTQAAAFKAFESWNCRGRFTSNLGGI